MESKKLPYDPPDEYPEGTDARSCTCVACGRPAYEFVFCIWKPSICGKPFCKKCMLEIK